MSFTSDTTEIKVQTSSEEWTTRVPSPGPFPTHVAITWDENQKLRYYENGSLRAESASAELSGNDNEETSMSVYREYVWLNELKLWNSVLPEFSAKNQHGTSKFTCLLGADHWKNGRAGGGGGGGTTCFQLDTEIDSFQYSF